MKPHPQSTDNTGGHYLRDSICSGCDSSSYVYCSANDGQYLGGGGGGCGRI